MIYEVVPTATRLPQLQHEKGFSWKINSITRDIGEYLRDVIFDPSINGRTMDACFRQYRYWLSQRIGQLLRYSRSSAVLTDIRLFADFFTCSASIHQYTHLVTDNNDLLRFDSLVALIFHLCCNGYQVGDLRHHRVRWPASRSSHILPGLAGGR
jgi:hypothetical protein